MAKLPQPPSPPELALIPPQPTILPAGTPLWHVYFRGGVHPRPWSAFREYGPLATARFDHHGRPPRVQDRAIYYAGALGPLCIAEVFQARRTINRRKDDPWLVGFRLARDVALLDLCGLWPTRAGASMAINSGPRSTAQRWSEAIYLAYPEVEGLWYASSMYGNVPALALYERARDAVGGTPFFHAPLAASGLAVPLYNLSRQLGYAFL